MVAPLHPTVIDPMMTRVMVSTTRNWIHDKEDDKEAWILARWSDGCDNDDGIIIMVVVLDFCAQICACPTTSCFATVLDRWRAMDGRSSVEAVENQLQVASPAS